MITSQPDRDLLVDIAAGVPWALDALYTRYRLLAYAVALRITADPMAAEDTVQDAFLGVWRNASGYRESRGTVKTWLLAIVHHRAVDVVRTQRRAIPLPDAEEVPPRPLWTSDVWPEVAALLDAAEVRTALGRLPEVQRNALELAYFGALSQTEIAARTGAPLGTVKGRLRGGLLALRRAFVMDVDQIATNAAVAQIPVRLDERDHDPRHRIHAVRRARPAPSRSVADIAFQFDAHQLVLETRLADSTGTAAIAGGGAANGRPAGLRQSIGPVTEETHANIFDRRAPGCIAGVIAAWIMDFVTTGLRERQSTDVTKRRIAASGVSQFWLATAWRATRPRRTFSKIDSAVAVQIRGLGWSLVMRR